LLFVLFVITVLKMIVLEFVMWTELSEKITLAAKVKQTLSAAIANVCARTTPSFLLPTQWCVLRFFVRSRPLAGREIAALARAIFGLPPARGSRLFHGIVIDL
jgi:hypothetical protein